MLTFCIANPFKCGKISWILETGRTEAGKPIDHVVEVDLHVILIEPCVCVWVCMYVCLSVHVYAYVFARLYIDIVFFGVDFTYMQILLTMHVKCLLFI